MSIILTGAVNETTDISETDGYCGICLLNQSKYTCPRCHLLYCSVACFKHQKHAGCSESFYKDCFVEELKQRRATGEEKRNILEMLRAFEEENSEDLDVQSLEDRLQGVDLDAIKEEELWNKLSKEEQIEFNDIVERNAASLIPVWTPWWLYHNKELVTEIGGIDDSFHTIPAATVKVPKLRTMLGNKEPSPLVCNNLVNILYPYAVFCRFYNGNTDDFAEEFCCHVFKCSTFLQQGKPISTLAEAICIAKERCVSHGVASEKTLLEAVLDVYHMLLGRDKANQKTYVKAALSQLYAETRSLKRKLKNIKHFQDLETRDAFYCLKRLEFLIAWVEDDNEKLTLLAIKIMALYKEERKELQVQRKAEEETKLLRKKEHKKPLSK